MTDFKLTPDQQVAVDSIIEFLDSDVYNVPFTLSGAAGTGKTFSIKAALKGRSNVVGATISHSAKDVLKSSLDGIADCTTLAQLLGLKQKIDDNGQISFVPSKSNSFYGGRELLIHSAMVLLIDECSMIDDETFHIIMSMKRADCKVIFLGDVYQLPPIKGTDDSITFEYVGAELYKPVRYTGPIADLGNIFRAEIDKVNAGSPSSAHLINLWQTDMGNHSRVSKVNEDGSGYIFVNDISKLVDIAVDVFKEAESSEDMRFIAYKNASTDKINHVTRAHIYLGGDLEGELPQFMPGELVICDGGYTIKTYDEQSGTRIHSVIYNNQTFTVVSAMDIPEGPGGYMTRDGREIKIPAISLKLDPAPKLPEGHSVHALDWEKGRYSYFDKHNELKRYALGDSKQWPRYYDYKTKWAWFDYGYAITSHRSQGRTFKDVIVFENDIIGLKNTPLKQKLQSLYVACTRASRRVYIYNKNSRVDNSQLPDHIREELGI